MIEVLKQALDALEFFSDTSNSAMDKAMSEDAITSLRQAIAEAEKKKYVGMGIRGGLAFETRDKNYEY